MYNSRETAVFSIFDAFPSSISISFLRLRIIRETKPCWANEPLFCETFVEVQVERHTFWKFQFPPRWIISCAKHGEGGTRLFVSNRHHRLSFVNLYPISMTLAVEITNDERFVENFICPALISNYSPNLPLFKSISISTERFLSRTTVGLLLRKLSFLVSFFETRKSAKDLQLLKWRNLGESGLVYVRAIAISKHETGISSWHFRHTCIDWRLVFNFVIRSMMDRDQ